MTLFSFSLFVCSGWSPTDSFYFWPPFSGVRLSSPPVSYCPSPDHWTPPPMAKVNSAAPFLFSCSRTSNQDSWHAAARRSHPNERVHRSGEGRCLYSLWVTFGRKLTTWVFSNQKFFFFLVGKLFDGRWPVCRAFVPGWVGSWVDSCTLWWTTGFGTIETVWAPGVAYFNIPTKNCQEQTVRELRKSKIAHHILGSLASCL